MAKYKIINSLISKNELLKARFYDIIVPHKLNLGIALRGLLK